MKENFKCGKSLNTQHRKEREMVKFIFCTNKHETKMFFGEKELLFLFAKKMIAIAKSQSLMYLSLSYWKKLID